MKKIYHLYASPIDKCFQFCLFLLSVLLLGGCASQYRHVEPHSMKYHNKPYYLYNGEVEVTYRYNILEKAKNKKYARMEKRSGISLLAVRIANFGNDTLFIPDDLLIEGRDNCVFPLEMNEAIEVFIQDNPVMDEVGSLANVQVNTGWGWVVPIAVSIPGLINNSIEEKANERFIKEMEDYYLIYSNVPPGETVSGLIALPVAPNTPLDFSKR